MHGKSRGSAGGLSFAGWPAPVPSSAQPADTSPAPQNAAQCDLALADFSRVEARSVTHEPTVAQMRHEMAQQAAYVARQAVEYRYYARVTNVPRHKAIYRRNALRAEGIVRRLADGLILIVSLEQSQPL